MAEEQPSKGHRRHVPKPDIDAHNAEVAVLNTRIQELRDRQNQIRETLGSTDRVKGRGDGPRADLKAQLAEIRRQQNGMKTSRQQILDQLKDISNTIKKKTDEIRNVKDKLQFKTLADIDRQIRQLEQQLEGGNIQLIEEKRIINEISSLKKSRKVVETFASQQESLDSEKKSADELRKQLDSMDPQRKALEASFTDIQNQITDLDKQKDGDFAKLNDIYAERNKIQEEIQAAFDQRRQTQDTFRKQKDEHFKFLQEERERRAEEAKIRKQQYDEERLRNEIAKVEEKVQIPAFQDELNTVSNLIMFFGQLQGDQKTAGETPVNGAAQVKEAAPSAPEKMVALKSKSARLDEMAFYVPKSKGKGSETASAGSTKRTGKAKALKLDISLLEALSKIKVQVPSSHDDLLATLQALEERKKYYEENADAENERIKIKTQTEIAALKVKLGKMAVNEGGDNADDVAAPVEAAAAEPEAVEA